MGKPSKGRVRKFFSSLCICAVCISTRPAGFFSDGISASFREIHSRLQGADFILARVMGMNPLLNMKPDDLTPFKTIWQAFIMYILNLKQNLGLFLSLEQRLGLKGW